MEITTRHRQLIIFAFVIITCVLFSFFAASSAQVVGTADAYPLEPGSGAARVPLDLPRMPGSLSPAEVGQGSEPPDYFEPNDTITQSKKIVICTPQKQYFEVDYDEDWIKFWAWDGYEYTIKTYSLTVRNNTELWLYDPEYILLDHDVNSGDEPDASKIVRTINENGIYFIKARHPTYMGGDGFDYSVHVSEGDLLPYGDSYEPDNTRDYASSITPGGTNQDHNFQGPCGGDVDWVSFFAEADTMYTIQTSDLSAGNDTVLTLYGSDGITVAVNDDSHSLLISPPASQIEWVSTVSGTYYVKIEPFNLCAGGSDLEYTVEVDEDPMGTPAIDPVPDPDSDKYEYDDRAGWAIPIVVNGEPQENHTFYPAEDEDWAKFWALAGNEYTIQTFDLPNYNDTELYLYNKDMQQLGYSDDIDPPDPPPADRASRIIWTAPVNGTYFVKVKHQYDEGDTDFSYSLGITGTATCQDAYEEDNTPSQIRPPITVDGTPQRHNFHNPCATDCGVTGYSVDVADWAWFEATAGVTYTIRTFDLGGDNDTVLGLYNISEVELASNDDAEQDNLLASEIVWTAPTSGPYYVKVSPFDRRIGGCDVDYYLEVTTDEYTLDINTVGSGSVARSLFPPYHHYDNVVLTVTADSGWTFYKWSGDLSGSDNPDTISMNGNKVVTATFTQDEYTLIVNVVGNGSVISDPVQATYHYDDIVDLTAVADTGWHFDGWSGDLTGSGASKSLPMQGNKEVTATFVYDEYTLTVNVVGNGSVARDPAQSTYHYGDKVTLTATADTGWLFGGWSGGVTGIMTETTVTMNDHTVVTATFGLGEYVLYANIVGDGTVEMDPPGSIYDYGDEVILTAVADLGWTFDNWSGALSGSNITGTVLMNENKSVTATFTQDVFTLIANVVGSGTVDLAPEAPYHYNDVVTLTANPFDLNWRFVGWSGDLSGADEIESITMNSHKVVTATFTFRVYIYLPLILRDWPPNDDPNTPVNVSPANHAGERSADVDLSWNGGDPNPGDTVIYDVHLGTSSPPPLKGSTGSYPATQTSITYDPGTLESETKYYWYIVARDSRGAVSDPPGEEWDFTTEGPTCLSSPANPSDCTWGEENDTASQAWGALCSEEAYRTCLGDDTDFYYIELGAPGTITIDLVVPSGTDYDLYLWYGVAAVDKSQEYGDNDEHISYSAPAGGTYYIEVRHWEGSNNATYTLTVVY